MSPALYLKNELCLQTVKGLKKSLLELKSALCDDASPR